MIGRMVGKYKILGEIGRGGMGVVYKALQVSLNRTVALKMLPSQMAISREFLERFQREARILARLAHQNIVHIYDLEEMDGAFFIVMEYIEGQSLAEIISRQSPLSLSMAKKVGLGAASALSVAHKAGIIHRDVKPENIMIDQHGEVKVMDFGIARAADETFKTRAGIKLGTPEYMSPEQAKGMDVDEQSDIYSLGIVLYEMATGKVPFSAQDSLAIALKHVQEPPVPPSLLCPSIYKDFEKIILKTLEKDRALRFKNADELCRALRKIDVPEEAETIAFRSPLAFLYCPQCGESLKEDFLRCPECGLVVRRQCPFCQGIFDAIHRVCPHCSQELPSFRPEDVPETVILKGPLIREPVLPTIAAQKPGIPVPQAVFSIRQKISRIFQKYNIPAVLFVTGALVILIVGMVLVLGGKKTVPIQDIDSDTESNSSLDTSDKGGGRTGGTSDRNVLSADDLDAMIVAGRDYFDRGEYDLCRIQMGKVLSLDRRNRIAGDYVDKAEAAKPKVTRLLDDAREAFQNKDYPACISACEEVLSISPRHSQALELINMAKAQSPDFIGMSEDEKEIQDIIERQRRGMETEDVPLVIQDIAPELAAQVRRDAENFFAQNKIIRVSFQNVKMDIKEQSATVTFTNRMEFIPSGSTAQRSESVPGKWQLEKREGLWKIVKF
ncbi:MAG: serine/threonine-protein kinase [Candidatus Aminicenantales bacterium]